MTEQAMTQAYQSLILDNKREILASKIKENLELKFEKEREKEKESEKEKRENCLKLVNEKLDRLKIVFCKGLMMLCREYFKLNASDLIKIADKEELLILESEVYKRARRGFKIIEYLTIPFLALIPIIGWICIICLYCDDDYNGAVPGIASDEFTYCRLHNKLIKNYGKDFFPFETLEQRLRQKICGDAQIKVYLNRYKNRLKGC